MERAFDGVTQGMTCFAVPIVGSGIGCRDRLLERLGREFSIMDDLDFYRFEQKAEDASILKGPINSHFIRDRDMHLIGSCQAVGKCIKAPTLFRRASETDADWFSMRPKGKILNLTYFLFEPEGTSPFSTITSKGGSTWRVLDSADRELYRFVDPTKIGEKVLRATLGGGAADSYVVVREGETLAEVRQEPRPDEEEVGQNQGILRRLAKWITTRSDWVLDVRTGGLGLDRRPLLAGMILLLEHTIPGRRT